MAGVTEQKLVSLGRKSARDILLSACGQCEEILCWKFNHSIECFVASCCKLVFKAEPLYEGQRFHVSYQIADHRNVVILSAIEI